MRTTLYDLGCTPVRPQASSPVQDRHGKRIARLHDRGCSAWQIAGALGLAYGTVQYRVAKLRRSRGERGGGSTVRVAEVFEPRVLERLRRELLAWWRRSGLTWTALAAQAGLPVQTVSRFRDGRNVPVRKSRERLERYLRAHSADLES